MGCFQCLLSSPVLEAFPEFLGLPQSTGTLQACHCDYPLTVAELDWKFQKKNHRAFLVDPRIQLCSYCGWTTTGVRVQHNPSAATSIPGKSLSSFYPSFLKTGSLPGFPTENGSAHIRSQSSQVGFLSFCVLGVLCEGCLSLTSC